MNKRLINLAVIGATGAVGAEVIKVLEKRRLPIANLHCLASLKSVGKEIYFQGIPIVIKPLDSHSFEGIDIAIFSAGGTISREWAPYAAERGVKVIDMSSAFRLDPHVPLIIPEINASALKKEHGITACPNCSTTLMLIALAPLHKKFSIKRVVVSTYQAASGAGYRAVLELQEETLAYLQGRPYQRSVMPHPYAFNLFSHNSPLTPEGYVEEELKMLYETRKILEDDQICVNATCVRVPVLRAHSEALNVTFAKPVSLQEIYSILETAPGLKIFEDRAINRFPMPSDASGQDEVLCGRIRKDLSCPNTFDLWVVGDQLLKGAALNAVQIAELILQRHNIP